MKVIFKNKFVEILLINAFLIFLFLCVKSYSFAQTETSEPPTIISFIPKETSRETIEIKGVSCPRCEVIVEVNENKFSTKSDEKGNFSIKAKLEKGKENILRIYSVSKNKTSKFSEYRIVHKELLAPKSIKEPPSVDLGSIPPFTREPGITVFGRALPKIKVVAKGGSSPAQAFSDENGYFEILVFLKFDQMNQIEIFMEEEGGFLSPAVKFNIYQITKAPPAPKIDTFPEYTNKSKIKIKGETIPGIKVVAELPTGAKIETVANKEGIFDLETSLTPNSENQLSFFSVDPAGNISAPTRIKIFQDSIPPDPPKIEFFPSRVFQEKITVIGKGEPETKLIAKILDKEIELGEVGKVGDFVVQVPVMKYQRQVRRNYIQIFSEDRAGNRSKPTMIIVDALPEIKRLSVEPTIGFHTFTGIFENSFFARIENSPYKFFGPSFEIQLLYIMQPGSGLSVGGTFGSSFSRSIRFEPPFLQDPNVKVSNPEEVSKLSFATTFILFSPKFIFLAESFDISFGIDIGPIFLVKSAPEETEQGVERINRLFNGILLRLSSKIRYFLTPAISVFVNPALGYAPIQKINREGDKIDAGGVYINLGISFGL